MVSPGARRTAVMALSLSGAAGDWACAGDGAVRASAKAKTEAKTEASKSATKLAMPMTQGVAKKLAMKCCILR